MDFYEIKQTATNLPEYKTKNKCTKSELFVGLTKVHWFRSSAERLDVQVLNISHSFKLLTQYSVLLINTAAYLSYFCYCVVAGCFKSSRSLCLIGARAESNL
jgi:hypothetical protein